MLTAAETSSSARSERPTIDRAVWALVTANFVFSVCFICVGFNHSIYDFHAFRQTQTAFCAQDIQQRGVFLNCQIPVLGAPWSIPFEFPLYQWVVARSSSILNLRLEQAGRLISIALFYASFLPIASAMRQLRFRSIQIAAVLSLFSVSPIYIFVSRLFMIESMALFFALLYVDQMFRISRSDAVRSYLHIGLAGILGTLAGLIKVTTFAPFFVLGTGVASWSLLKPAASRRINIPRVSIACISCAAIPALSVYLWTSFADAKKAASPIAKYETSKALASWNYGTLAQRVDWKSYAHLWWYFDLQCGSATLTAGVMALYIIVFRRFDRAALVCLGLYFATIMTFFNLHVVHAYYGYAVAVFVIAAEGILIGSMLELPDARAWMGMLLLSSATLTSMFCYLFTFYQLQRKDVPGYAALAGVIESTTPADSVVVITGENWSPMLAYQSHRRAIMDMDKFANQSVGESDPTQMAIRIQGIATIGEVIVCGDHRGTLRARKLLDLVAISNNASFHADDCDVYLKDAH